MGSALISRQQLLDTLSAHGIRGPEVYLLDAVPLIELAWSDGVVQPQERVLILSFVEHLMVKLRAEAGFDVISHAQALAFVNRLTTTRPGRLEFTVWLQCLKTLLRAQPQGRARHAAIMEGLNAIGGVAPSPTNESVLWDENEVGCLSRLEFDLRLDV
ncbi:MAG: hypothetical protein JNJ54_07895 [Myxococcaceae bacterium]|nr:hypothetical protein [Myxococcaceae bacterium]